MERYAYCLAAIEQDLPRSGRKSVVDAADRAAHDPDLAGDGHQQEHAPLPANG